jgi:hypothetical protein
MADNDSLNKGNTRYALGICGVAPVNWLSQGAVFNRGYFDENILQPIAAELCREEKKKYYSWTLPQMENMRPRASKRNLAQMDELCFKRVVHPPFGLDVALSNFFLFGWLKSKPSSRSMGEIGELFETVDETRSTLRLDTIATVFGNWIERLKQFIIIWSINTCASLS